jgi:hypothetical protein
MEDEIVSFETAMLLKEKGFNEPCSYYYEDNELCKLGYYHGEGTGFVRNNSPIDGRFLCEKMQCTAPTQSLAQKWLRETRNVTFNANPHSNDGKIIYVVTIKVISSNKYVDFNVMMDTSNKATMFDTYEDAIESGLKHCLKSI